MIVLSYISQKYSGSGKILKVPHIQTVRPGGSVVVKALRY